MLIDLPNHNPTKLRRDWGLQNMASVGMPRPSTPASNAQKQRVVQQKINTFLERAIYPQQLTISRQYATTQEGVTVFRVLEGRTIDGIQEQGVRVVVQENGKQARFVMSPLFGSKHDALMWAKRQMGVH